jgi:uncharacterized protein
VSYQIDVADLHDIARGAALLGTGGGGDPHIGRLLAEQAIRENGPVTVLDPSELGADDLVIPTGMMGAPSVAVERIPNGNETVTALRTLEEHLGRPATATMPIECGGLNSLIPIATAAKAGLPIVDADGMGRAFPELQMETFGVYGVSAGPMAVAGTHDDVAVITTAGGNARYEWLSRGLTIRLGGASYMGIYPMTGEQVQRTAIHRTLTLCRDLGATLRGAREEHVDPFAALAEALSHTHYPYLQELFHGKVTDVMRRTERGFTVGEATVTGRDGETLDLVFQNEFTTASKDGRILCMVPDLICVLDEETAEPITTETLRFGHRVRIVGIATPPIMRTPESLEVFGPRMFGIDSDYVPVEEIWALV